MINIPNISQWFVSLGITNLNTECIKDDLLILCYLIVWWTMFWSHCDKLISIVSSSSPDSIPPPLMTLHVLQPVTGSWIRNLRTMIISNPASAMKKKLEEDK